MVMRSFPAENVDHDPRMSLIEVETENRVGE